MTDEVVARHTLKAITAQEEALLGRLRAICVGLPEVTERLSHGEPTWFVRDKKTFVNMDSHHHNAAHYAFWCAAPFGAQDAMISANPERYFRPPYVGHRGWVGVRLDTEEVDWDEIEMVVRDAYRMIAPPKLAALVS
jgi:hypothetical protein